MQEKELIYKGDTEKKLESFPAEQREKFVADLVRLQYGLQPMMKTKSMQGLGKGVIEICKNGKPAYRVVYVIKDEKVYVLEAFVKTSNQTDSKHEKTIKQRYRDI
ncbi:Addiction module toxin RelE [Vibrio crassostreae]|jgi:phage-related protein|nr:type II toxin-antitoxin system RelE/ParE family toxin [Vibrio splendidus]AKN38664.1 hypothetical protein [Vibrio tasmaniensis]CAK1881134.1 Addiction module toxin RelE [Vibrio crassostreae]CAK2181841.1 Addiction module toxin RelE [Vibrio crassostreae]CAK2195532.1 Addiction module toxin RelE [Vibrio crassostreae]CAK2860439.1 Addiction module toxin RelE [Vibrio crassostreae]